MFPTLVGHAGTSVTALETRRNTIEQHLPLVSFTVNRMSELIDAGVMEREDAIGYGLKGLIDAVDNYNPEKGTTFATYAVLRIRGAVLDAARKMDIMPRSQRQRIRALEAATWELSTCYGRSPTPKELAVKLALPVDEIKRLENARGLRVQSLDAGTLAGDDEQEWQIADPDESSDPAAVADRKALSSALQAALSTLESRDRRIMEMHYNHGMPFRTIGEDLRISESRVCQLHARILRGLRMQLAQVGLAA